MNTSKNNQSEVGAEKPFTFGLHLFARLIVHHEGDIRLAKESCVELIDEAIKEPSAAKEILSYYGLGADFEMDLLALCMRWIEEKEFRHKLIIGTAYEGSDVDDDYFIDPYHDEQD
jgi:hypothetical protein